MKNNDYGPVSPTVTLAVLGGTSRFSFFRFAKRKKQKEMRASVFVFFVWPYGKRQIDYMTTEPLKGHLRYDLFGLYDLLSRSNEISISFERLSNSFERLSISFERLSISFVRF